MVSSPFGPNGIFPDLDDDPRAQNETLIALSPTMPGLLLVSANDESYGPFLPGSRRNYRLGFMTSQDGGASWVHDISADQSNTSQNLPEPTECSLPTGPPGWGEQQLNPGVAIGGSGYMFLVGRIIETDPNHLTERSAIVFARQPVAAPAPPMWEGCNTIAGTCRPATESTVYNPRIIADRSGDPGRAPRAFATWGLRDGTKIFFAYSLDSGTDWLNQTSPPPVEVESCADPDVCGSLEGSVADVGPDGEVYIAWLRRYFQPPPFDSRIEAARWNGPGQGFTFLGAAPYPFDELGLGVVRANTNYNINSHPSMAIDWTNCCTRGYVYVVSANEGMMNSPYPPDQADVWVSRFTPQPPPGHWEAPVNVTAGAPPGTHQYLPGVAVDDYGRVGVFFLDRREEGPEKEYAVYFSVSENGGRTWSSPHVRVMDTGVVSNPKHGSVTGFDLELGDSFGLTSEFGTYHDRFYAVWTDLRNWASTEGSEAGDVFFASIRVSMPDFDHDCDIDLTDFQAFQLCFGGSNNPPAPTCPPGVDADLDGDGDVDLTDFIFFQQKFTASGVCWCPVGCGGSEGGEGESGAAAPEGTQSGPTPSPEPTPEERYRMLFDYCQRHGIPFT